MRWPIEQCFEEGKSHLEMGDMSIVLGRHGIDI